MNKSQLPGLTEMNVSSSSVQLLEKYKLKKPFKETYSGFESTDRKLALAVTKLSAKTTDVELFDALDKLFETLSIVEDNRMLSKKLATLTIESYINKGFVKIVERDLYIKLATSSYDVTVDLLNNRFQNTLELEGLMKLSGRELYHAGKFERLKEVNTGAFEVKYKEWMAK